MLAVYCVGAAVLAVALGVVFAVYRSGDFQRVARSCAQKAVAMEREQVNRILIANATALRKAGRRQHAQVADQLLACLNARPPVDSIEVEVNAFTRRKDGDEKEEGITGRVRRYLAARGLARAAQA